MSGHLESFEDMHKYTKASGARLIRRRQFR